MVRTTKVNDEHTRLNLLATEVSKLFNEAVSVRQVTGITDSLRSGYIREFIDDGAEGETVFTPVLQEDCSNQCFCKPDSDEKCDVCDSVLENVCSLDDTLKNYKEKSPFSNVANLLTTVKKYEFISLVENAYAQIGDKPFKLKATKDPTLTEEQIEESAKAFYEFLENYLETNDVRIDEIADAFNLDTLGEVTQTLADAAQEETNLKIQEALVSNEVVMERVFKRSEFMTKYMEVIKDTTDYPIGVLWIDDKSLKKERYVKGGKLNFRTVIQADVERVDPYYFWATEDHTLNNVGRAVFKLQQFTKGDMMKWIDKGVVGSEHLEGELKEYLESWTDGYKNYNAMLFSDHRTLNKGLYDVLICRGKFDREQLEELDVEIPDFYSDDCFLPCEIYYSGGKVIRARVMNVADERLGVYTTVFRRKNERIFGYSLHEFLYPFAKLYQGAIDAVDQSVGKSVSSIIQVDTGVMDDADNYLHKDERTGEATLDLSGDTLIEFNSNQGFTSPNFKGVPLTIDQLPSDLNKLLPVVDFVVAQLERISGIPSILVNGDNISSALRTNSNFNAAFSSSAKTVQALLRESENRILKPSIRYIFDAKAMVGDMNDFLIETEPEILLSDTLAREVNDDRDLLQGVQTLAQFSQIIPAEKLAGLINTVGREVYNLEEDLVPGVGPLKTSAPVPQPQSV